MDRAPTKLSAGEKRRKIESNYETINELRSRVEAERCEERTGMTRAAYIRTILDVTEKVNKQDEELARVVVDNRKLQRTIASLSGRLERSFALVEDMLLRGGAKTDGWSRACYRLLSTMHESCERLIGWVQETGELTREIRQLEDQIGQLKAKQAG